MPRIRADWLLLEQTPNGLYFKVHQRWLEPLKNSLLTLLLTPACILTAYLLLPEMNSFPYLGILFAILLIIALACFVLGIVALFSSAVILLSNTRVATFQVTADGIEINPGRHSESTIKFTDIERLFAQNSKHAISASTVSEVGNELSMMSAALPLRSGLADFMIGVAANLHSILNKHEAKVALSYNGKTTILAKRLSDEEADLLFNEVVKHTGFEKFSPDKEAN